VLAIAKIDKEVESRLSLEQSIDVFLVFEKFDYQANSQKFDIVNHPESISNEMAFALRGIYRQNVHDVLSEFATQKQAEAKAQLIAQGIQFESFWLTNEILVKDATKGLVNFFANLSGVLFIELNTEEPLMEPVEIDYSEEETDYVQWNIQHIKAPEAWRTTKGRGVTVANIDTGVKFDHEALFKKYRGYHFKSNSYDHDYNFFDPKPRNGIPWDFHGHGTHTMGTIVGSTGSKFIGVAPEASFIAAKGCATNSCSREHLIKSGQWVMCPTKMDGSDSNCNLGADVVSNSWGGGIGNDWYGKITDAWVAANMIPVFSAGNSGSRCFTTNSPGDMSGVISAASSNQRYSLSRFSSRGPGPTGGRFSSQKPDITAPGEKVLSSTPDGKYAAFSGTSMACPHISGVAALMIAVNPKHNYHSVYQKLMSTANLSILSKPADGEATCGGKAWNERPNNHYGFGLVDAKKCVSK
jgi:subtilisin family serine protease